MGHKNVTCSPQPKVFVVNLMYARIITVLYCFRGHINVVSSSCFSYDSHYVATASWDKTVQLYDIATGVYRYMCICIYVMPELVGMASGIKRAN